MSETNTKVALELFGEAKPAGQPVVTGHISTLTMFEDYPWIAWVPGFVVDEDEWVWVPRSFVESIENAWLAVDKMRADGWTIDIGGGDDHGGWEVCMCRARGIKDEDVGVGISESVKTAICEASLAALKAVEE